MHLVEHKRHKQSLKKGLRGYPDHQNLSEKKRGDTRDEMSEESEKWIEGDSLVDKIDLDERVDKWTGMVGYTAIAKPLERFGEKNFGVDGAGVESQGSTGWWGKVLVEMMDVGWDS